VARSGRRARILIWLRPARSAGFVKETPLPTKRIRVAGLQRGNPGLCPRSNQPGQKPVFPANRIETRRYRCITFCARTPIRTFRPGPGFDLIYCGGLFDYLSEPTASRWCISLRLAAAGGMVIVANMSDSKPFATSLNLCWTGS